MALASCGGSRDEKAAAAFALYDYNGDGVISLEEMTRYLTSVFKVMYETQPGTAERVGVSAVELDLPVPLVGQRHLEGLPHVARVDLGTEPDAARAFLAAHAQL